MVDSLQKTVEESRRESHLQSTYRLLQLRAKSRRGDLRNRLKLNHKGNNHDDFKR